MFLHKMLTINLVAPNNHIESAIDDFEISFRIPRYWQQISDVKKPHLYSLLENECEFSVVLPAVDLNRHVLRQEF